MAEPKGDKDDRKGSVSNSPCRKSKNNLLVKTPKNNQISKSSVFEHLEKDAKNRPLRKIEL